MERYVATQFYKADSPESRILRESGIAPSEFVLAADAQATIAALEETILKMGENAAVVAKDAMAAKEQVAALQGQVRELERDRYKQGFADALEKVASDWASKEFRGHDEIQSCEVQAFLDTRHVHYEECRGVKPLQSQLTQRTAALRAERDAARRRVDELEAREVDVVMLREDLEQRTAELEALRKWRDYVTVALQRPGGAFFEDVPKHIIDLVAELERVRAQVQQLEKDNATLHQFWMNADDWLAYNDKQAAIQRERDILRTLVAALPKVEGAVVVSNGYVKDSTRCHALFGADEDAASYAALLRARRGKDESR